MWSAWSDTPPLNPPAHMFLLIHDWILGRQTKKTPVERWCCASWFGSGRLNVLLEQPENRKGRVGHHFYQNVFYTVFGLMKVSHDRSSWRTFWCAVQDKSTATFFMRPMTVATHNRLSRWKTGHSFQMVFKESRFVPNHHSFDTKGIILY